MWLFFQTVLLRYNSYNRRFILLKYNLIFSTFTELCIDYYTSDCRAFFSLPKRNPTPLAVTPRPPLPHILRPSHLLSVSVGLPGLDVSYKWNSRTCGLLRLASSAECNVFTFRSRCSVYQHFSPFHHQAVFTAWMHRTYSTWWALRCSHSLAVMSNAVNTGVRVFMWTCFLPSLGVS